MTGYIFCVDESDRDHRVQTVSVHQVDISSIMIAADTDVETFLNYEPHQTNDTAFHPGTAHTYTRERDAFNVVISDVRGREVDFSLDQQGFEFHKHESSEKDFNSDEIVRSVVYDEVKELLKEK